MPQSADIVVNVTTNYPQSADTVITVKNLPRDYKVKLNLPAFIAEKSIEEGYKNGVYKIVIKGKLGHYVEEYNGNIVLKYGPLVLSPSVYYWGKQTDLSEGNVPAGYIPAFLPSGKCDIICKEKDENGFLKFETEPIPEWSYFEEGPFSRTWVKNTAVNVKVRFENGRDETLRFTPLCYNISNLSCYDVPIIFNSLI